MQLTPNEEHQAEGQRRQRLREGQILAKMRWLAMDGRRVTVAFEEEKMVGVFSFLDRKEAA